MVCNINPITAKCNECGKKCCDRCSNTCKHCIRKVCKKCQNDIIKTTHPCCSIHTAYPYNS